MIELRGVARDFDVGGRPVHALRPTDLDVGEADYLSIMGPSGSGKSTLLNILGCLDRPTAGTYRLNGTPVDTLDDRALARVRGHEIGFVFQSYHLVPRLTAAANVELPMVFAGVERGPRRTRVDEALAAVGLADRCHHRPDQLSGGERQRVAIARAIVMRPRVVLADEPTGNLDSAVGLEILQLLEGMQARRLTLIVVTHDAALAARASRRLRMTDGRVHEVAP
jgi:putative ABC transport system ATP-binding protein